MNRLASIASSIFLLANSGIVVFARPPNDRCVDSITLVPFEKIIGDNSDANYDFVNQGVCGARSDRRAVWYEINGKGKEVTVNLCTNNDKLTDFGVFTYCNTQKCLGAPPQQKEVTNCDADESNEFSFLALNGNSYYIHVRSDVLFEGEGSNFTIWYTEPTDEPTATPVVEEAEPSETDITPTEPSSGERATTFYNTVVSFMVAGLVYSFA
mmetsp:Transcript_20220/g.47359  ORF Transcript_20220/g.47359 Transcript_20220/m.47359 type:complete len:211 (-) Transcript_20220:604-1236(-)